MPPAQPPTSAARIITLTFDPALLVSRHDRCHSGAEYLADIASSAGPDTAMAAREISACVFEVFELIRHDAPSESIQVLLTAAHGGVDVRVRIPGDGSMAQRYAEWLEPADGRRDPLAAPDPGDGIRELMTVHGVSAQSAATGDGVRLDLHVPLLTEAADAASDAARGATDGR